MEIVSIEKKRKQRFAVLCIAFSLVATIVFTIVDFVEGDIVEFIVDVIMTAVFIAALMLLKKSRHHLLVYRIVLILLTLAFLYNILIGAGNGTAIYWLFPFPLVYLFLLGKNEGALVATVFFVVLCLLLINPFSLTIYEYGPQTSLRFLASLLLVIMMAYGMEASREKFAKLLFENQAKLTEEKESLQKAMGEIKTLHGLIPICCNCKKIRNDEGYWQQVEVYVSDHTHADFSHGLCPDCARKLYQSCQHAADKEDRPKQTQTVIREDPFPPE